MTRKQSWRRARRRNNCSLFRVRGGMISQHHACKTGSAQRRSAQAVLAAATAARAALLNIRASRCARPLQRQLAAIRIRRLMAQPMRKSRRYVWHNGIANISIANGMAAGRE